MVGLSGRLSYGGRLNIQFSMLIIGSLLIVQALQYTVQCNSNLSRLKL